MIPQTETELLQLFEKVEDEILSNRSDSVASQIRKIVAKIERLTQETGITFAEGVQRYYDPSRGVDEREEYYTFYFYLKSLSNTIRNAQEK